MVNVVEGRLWIRNGKRKKNRIVPLGGRAKAVLGAYLNEARAELVREASEASVFISLRGGRLSEYGIQRRVRQWGEEVGLKGLHPHLLRHACATHLLRGGADIRHVQELLGDRRLDTTAVYTRVETSDGAGKMPSLRRPEICWQTGLEDTPTTQGLLRMEQQKQKRQVGFITLLV